MAGNIKFQGTKASMRPKAAWLEATVTRADGTVERLGEVARTDFTLAGKLRALFSRLFGKAPK